MGVYSRNGHRIEILRIILDFVNKNVIARVDGWVTLIYFDPIHIPGSMEKVFDRLIEQAERDEMGRLGLGCV